MMHVHITLFSHVRGLALNLEAEAQAEQDSGLTSDEWMQIQEHDFRVIAPYRRLPAAESVGQQRDGAGAGPVVRVRPGPPAGRAGAALSAVTTNLRRVTRARRSACEPSMSLRDACSRGKIGGGCCPLTTFAPLIFEVVC